MKRHFVTHAILQVLISDNARQFLVHEFEEFSQKCNVKHTTSSPHYSQAISVIEPVTTANNLLIWLEKMAPMFILV